MAVIFASDTFLPALNSGENFLKLRDTNGNIRYKIYNNTISSNYVNGDTLVIKTEADSKIISLKFASSTEAQNAIIKLQTVLAQIKNNFNVKKESKFSDTSFAIYNDLNPTQTVDFTVSESKSLTFGAGNILQTETEVADEIYNSQNTETSFKYFEHFLKPHQLIQGTYTTAIFKYASNEIAHKGIFEMSVNSPAAAYLWSSVNAFLLDQTFNFKINLKVTNSPDANNDFKIVIGFFNQNSINMVNRGAQFVFDSTLNNNWLTRTMNSTATLQNTLVPLDNVWHVFEIRLADNGTDIEFLIDDISVSTIDTNIPNTIGAETAFGVLFEKNASNQATSVLIDYLKCDVQL